MLQLYGKEYKPWDELYGSFIEPTMRGMAMSTNPIAGAYKFAVPGYLLAGGPFGALAGGIIGAGYGTVHGLYRSATDTAYIPGIVKERREIENYFDAAKYERNKRMADLSTGLSKQEYVKAMNSTLTAFNDSGQDVANLFRGTPYMEKPYIEPWLNTKNKKERQEILKYIPEELGTALKKQWSKNDLKDSNQEYNKNSSADVAAGSKRYKFDRSILDPSIQLEDIKLKTVENAGYSAHDFGLGWNQQMYRMQGSYNDIKSAEVAELESYTTSSVNSGQIRQTIIEMIRQRNFNGTAQVYINESANDTNVINITIRRDRSLSIINALRNRSQYNG